MWEQMNSMATVLLGICGLVITVLLAISQNKISEAQLAISTKGQEASEKQILLQKLTTIRECSRLLKDKEAHMKKYAYLALDRVEEREMVASIVIETGDPLALEALGVTTNSEGQALTSFKEGQKPKLDAAVDSIHAKAKQSEENIDKSPKTSQELKGKWVYLGHWIANGNGGTWETRYFSFEKNLSPEDLKASRKPLKVLEARKSVYIRDTAPTNSGEFGKILGVIKHVDGTEITLDEVTNWGKTGYMWGKIKD